MLVATAGHIDHGKTSLIRALTGVETDRLPEERLRGISIDLGFAHWRPDGATISFVDVPGHERFVRNMLAGVTAVDFALLVVAADDGVMPQTLEHVQILDLLGIDRGIVAITKCDRSTPERIDAVRIQVRQLLAGTSLAGLPQLEVSTVTSVGIAELGVALRAASRTPLPRRIAGHNFRLAIDRVFSVTGTGTIVTGTVLEGAVETGTRLMLSPRGLETRVRGLQSGGQSVSRIESGERCALNLTGIEVAQAHRGDWLCVPAMHAPTSRVEARLKVLSERIEPLRHNLAVHLHLGTADIPARVLIPKQGALLPGEEAIVQLALDHPTCAIARDRFVLRDQSGRQLVGGGVIVDPFVAGDRRGAASRAPVSAALQQPDDAAVLSALLAIPGHEVDTQRFERSLNLEAAAAQVLYRSVDAVLLGSTRSVALPATRVAELCGQIIALLQTFHREHPEEGGMTLRAIRAGLDRPVSAEAFLALQRELIEKRQIAAVGAFVKLASHSASFSSAENALWQKLLPALERRGADPFTVRDLAGQSNASEAFIKMLLFRRRSNGEVWRITDTRFMLRKQIAMLAASAAAVAAIAAKKGAKGFTAAEYRDAIGTGRTLAIQILEFFDTIGVTLRSGDLRRMRTDYDLVVGSSPPITVKR